jgi:hypothetical protein
MARGGFARWVALAAVVAFGSMAAAAPAVTPPTLPGASTNASARVGSLRLHATLGARQIVPAPSAAAAESHGMFNGTLQHRLVDGGQGGGQIVWNLSWSLSALSLTGPVTAVEIRTGRRGEVGPVLLTLCQDCGASPAGVAHQLAKGEVHALRASALYVNVATAANPGGEVRGQLTRPGRQPAPTAGNNGPAPGSTPGASP